MFPVGRILQRFLTSTNRERVIEVRDAGRTVVTEVDGKRCAYYECAAGYSIGQELDAPPKHRRRSYLLTWSPWDEREDD